MTSHAAAIQRRSPDAYLAIGALALGSVWAACLMLTPIFGAAAYAIPAALLVAGLACWALLLAASGQARGTIMLAAFVIIILNLNFRQRELGETGLDWQNGLKLVAWLAMAGVAALRLRDVVNAMRDPAFACAALFSIVAALSSVWSVDPAYTAASALGLFAYLGLAWMIARDVEEGRAISVIVWCLAAYIAINLAAAIFVSDTAWLAPSAEETVFRLQGMAGHPNVLGQQTGVFLTIAIIARRRLLVSRIAFLALIALGLSALVLTGSRTTMIAVAVSWGVVAIRQRGFLPHAVALVMLMVGVVFFTAAAGLLSDLQSLLGGLSRTGRGNEILTLTGRTELWSAAWQLFLERPLTGWGYNGTEGLLSQIMGRSFVGTAVNAHNMFLQCLMSVGLIGSVFGFGFVAILLVRAFKRPDPTRDQIIALAIMIGLGEVEIFATPVMLTLIVFWIIAREARSHRVAEVHDTRMLRTV